MASIVLGAVGSVAGAAIGGATGMSTMGLIGEAVGSIAGNYAEDALLSALSGGKKTRRREGPRLSDLSVQTSTYGKVLPSIYGTARIAGNVIWSQPIKETITTTTSGGKGGGTQKQTDTNYSYSITMAIAICTGEVDQILRVWADAKLVDPEGFAGSYAIYKGTETQTADPVIEGFEGVGSTPAYRGISYVVIEDFPLADFGNRIPNFTFEVRKSALTATVAEESVEEMIKSMVMIPGSGEVVYDTMVQHKISGETIDSNWVQGGNNTRINQNNHQDKADALVALDQLEETCKNLEWVAVVVGWFGDDLDAGTCVIKPGVEYNTGATIDPDNWAVGSTTRSTAYLISTDAKGNPVYGGTPSDTGLLRYLDELQSRGLKVMFYPMFFMDTVNKPWRGRVTGSAADVATFFTKTNGYNAFINHYANLVKTKVDAFVIGSELIGLTKVQDVDNSFPAVDELVSLAATVKTTVGSGVKVTYAADWSEYHHTDGGWYNLDPLWASSSIDMVGIDSYFPLTDEVQAGYDMQKIMNGWTSGEGFDWVYTDENRTTKDFTIEAKYAWKNIDWWWKNNHVNPDLATTAWIPQSKKIWFTEYGFPSLDGATNQPNVFYDPNSSESSFPRFSKGRVDFQIQRLALKATETQWKNSTMIERMFVWTWDARPYPFWPDLLNIWTDGNLWKTGHWVQGKLGISSLAAIVSDLCIRSGLAESDFDVSALFGHVEGYILDRQITCKRAIAELQKAYFFDGVESDGVVKFVHRGGSVAEQILESDLVIEGDSGSDKLLEISRTEELELPQKIDVTYINRSSNYLVGNQHSQRSSSSSDEQYTVNLPIVLTNQLAKNIADTTLFNFWMERNSYRFMVSSEYAYLEPTDIVEVTVGSATHTIRITNIEADKPGILKISGLAEDISVYDFYNDIGDTDNQTGSIDFIPETSLKFLDLPAMPNDEGGQGLLRIAATGLEDGWQGTAIYRSHDSGTNYSQIAALGEESAIGTATTILADGVVNVFDEVNAVTVLLLSGELSSASEMAILNGANIAKIGNEIIQFKTATLLSANKYQLSGFLRGRAGTESETGNHIAGENFTLLDNRIAKIPMANSLIGLSRKYKGVTIGGTLGTTTAQDFTYNAEGLKPFSPVHITGSRDGSSNLMIDWVRRTRIGGDWRDNVDIPLSEESEAYEVDIMNGANVVRTITGLGSTQASYTAAEQTIDFGSTQSSVSVKVYQLSAIVGRGTAGEGSV